MGKKDPKFPYHNVFSSFSIIVWKFELLPTNCIEKPDNLPWLSYKAGKEIYLHLSHFCLQPSNSTLYWWEGTSSLVEMNHSLEHRDVLLTRFYRF